jgi:ATP/maltotriose-dependent transcriptional regulator MalT
MSGARRSTSEFIASKTRVPAPREEFTVRPRLLEQLIGSAGPMVKIEAPAGYGKSTLL